MQNIIVYADIKLYNNIKAKQYIVVKEVNNMSELTEIYYFSGTGNSFQLACDIADRLPNCAVIKMTEYNNEPVCADRVGVVFPVYMWGIPKYVSEFLKRLNIGKDKYIFAAATYGGSAGKALDIAQEILERRGLQLSAGFLVRMPDNYIIGYNAPSEKKQAKLFKAEKHKAEHIAQTVGYMKKPDIEKSRLVFDRIFAGVLYKKLNGVHDMDKGFTVNDKCTSCGKCVNVCPVGNIKLTDGKPQWTHRCELCLGCLQRCPARAIDYKNKTRNRKRYVNSVYKCSDGSK